MLTVILDVCVFKDVPCPSVILTKYHIMIVKKVCELLSVGTFLTTNVVVHGA